MRLHTEQSYWWRSKFLSECAWIVTCVHARTYASMLGDVIRACMAREILVQLSTDTHEFEKYSRGAMKCMRVTRTRASSLNRAVPYIPSGLGTRSIPVDRLSGWQMKIHVL